MWFIMVLLYTDIDNESIDFISEWMVAGMCCGSAGYVVCWLSSKFADIYLLM